LLLFLNDSHDEGFECLRNIVRLADTHVVHPEKTVTIDAGKFLKLFAPLHIDDVDENGGWYTRGLRLLLIDFLKLNEFLFLRFFRNLSIVRFCSLRR
jgi:hypothetical protein